MTTTRLPFRRPALNATLFLGGVLLIAATACEAFDGDALHAKAGRFYRADDGALVKTMTTSVAMYEALLSGVGERASGIQYLQTHRRSLQSRPLRVILGPVQIAAVAPCPAHAAALHCRMERDSSRTGFATAV